MVRQAHNYLAGAVSGTALVAAAVVAFAMLVSLQSLRDWPLAGLFAGDDSAGVAPARAVSAGAGGAAASSGEAANGAFAGSAQGAGRRTWPARTRPGSARRRPVEGAHRRLARLRHPATRVPTRARRARPAAGPHRAAAGAILPRAARPNLLAEAAAAGQAAAARLVSGTVTGTVDNRSPASTGRPAACWAKAVSPKSPKAPSKGSPAPNRSSARPSTKPSAKRSAGCSTAATELGSLRR